ncbi:hypothetical protein TSUD_09760 [Trifolium subterraneum]|nr:hypothetical protein TSUD_09760 [Trifolium subterraneum]
MLGECQTLLLNFPLQAQSSDRWQWQPDPDVGYIVRGSYELLTSQVSATTDDVEKFIWHSQVPLKVSIFAWRLVHDRLPTKANMITCGILYHVAVRSWIDITSADPTSLRDHFVQFTYSAGGSLVVEGDECLFSFKPP